MSSSTSAVSPELEMASSTSSRVIMPMSPWLASAACMKKEGVPVEASVAAIFPAMCPDLPMPLTMTRPRHSRQMLQARAKVASSRGTSAAMARPSIFESQASGGDQRGRIGLELGIHAAIITLKITR